MPLHDWFVGAVSIVVGLTFTLAAGADAAWFFQLAKPRLVAASMGRGRARFFIAAVGLAFIALGVWIAAGYRVAWSAS